MTLHPTWRGAGRQGAAQVALLKPCEAPKFDGDRMVELFFVHGEVSARQMLSDAVDQLGTHLTDLFAALRQARFDEVAELAGQIANTAAHFGLTSCWRISRDLTKVARRGDLAACSAILHRLARHVAGCARSAWNAQDLSS